MSVASLAFTFAFLFCSGIIGRLFLPRLLLFEFILAFSITLRFRCGFCEILSAPNMLPRFVVFSTAPMGPSPFFAGAESMDVAATQASLVAQDFTVWLSYASPENEADRFVEDAIRVTIR